MPWLCARHLHSHSHGAVSTALRNVTPQMDTSVREEHMPPSSRCKRLLFLVMTPFSLVGGYQHFGGTQRLRLQGTIVCVLSWDTV
jgi:hypothetical protein